MSSKMEGTMFDSQLWKSFSEGSDMRSQIMDAPILGFCFLVSWQIFFYNPFMQFSVKPYPKPHWNRGFASGRIWSLSIKKRPVQPMIWNHTKNNNYFPFKLWILYVDYNLLVFSPHFWSEQIPNFWEKAAKSPPSGKAGNVASIKSVVSISRSSVSDRGNVHPGNPSWNPIHPWKN